MPMDASRRNLISISFSQFGTAFSSNFIMVFFPFYILKVSPYPLEYTLLWTGAIMGSTSICSAFTSPFWGSLTHRFSPKVLYLRALFVNFASFFLMGFTTDLRLLFLLRVCNGLASGSSTIGLIITSSSSPKEKLSSNIGLFQSSMTLGQLIGPLLGSLGAATLGYRGAFVAASAVVLLSFVFCFFYVTKIPTLPKKQTSSKRIPVDRQIIIDMMLCFMATIQITFLPSVLPRVLEGFQYEHAAALKLAGVIVMLHTATAMIGIYAWSRLARRIGLHGMITFLFLVAILLQSAFTLSRGVVDFTVLRMLQTGFIAATFSIVVSIFAGESRGGLIGLLNSSRYAGNALGPMLATSVLAFTNLSFLYLFMSGMTLLAFLSFRAFFRSSAV